MHVGERFWFAERRDNTLAMAKLTLAEKSGFQNRFLLVDSP